MTVKKIYRAAVIGCGRIGSILEDDPLRPKPCTHAGAFSANRRIELVAGCDINESRLRKFGKRWGVKKLYTEHRELLKNEQLDIVSVATWTDSHLEITINLAKSKVRIIICEKPIALGLDKAFRMVRLCKVRGSLLVINHERRFDYLYIKAKEMIKKGRIGKVRTVTGNVLTSVKNRHKSFIIDKSSLMHDGTHLLDILRFLLGEPEWVMGFVSKKHKETSFGIFNFKGNIPVFIETGGLREYFNFELDIQGTRGRLLIGNEAQKLWIKKKSPRYSGFTELEEIKFPDIPIGSNQFRNEMADIVSYLDYGKSVNSTGEDGLKALRMIFGLFESAKNGSKFYFNFGRR